MGIQMSLALQTVVKKFNLEVTMHNQGNYRVYDNVIASFYRGVDPDKRGVYIHRKLDNAIQDAVNVRKEHDAEMTRRSGLVITTLEDLAEAKRQREAKRRRKAGTPMPVAPDPLPPTPPPPPVAQVAPKPPRVVIDDDPVDGDLELDDVELDNTGQRLKKFREPPRTSKSESVFLRSARVIVKRPTIGQEALAKDAIMAMASAKVCRVAFNDIVATLDAAGFISTAGKHLVPPPKPKKKK